MVATSWPRQSYQARVLLVPLDQDARSWVATRGPAALDGITTAEESLLDAGRTVEPGSAVADGRPTGSASRAHSTPLDLAVHDADVVVLFTHDLGAVDREAVIAIADSARPSGTLVGAIVVSPGAGWAEPDEAQAISTIRETVDNVVILKDDRFVLAFLQVLRGGVQDDDSDDPAAPRVEGVWS